MALTGVLRPGHAQIRVLDLEESVKFYTHVMGLKEVCRDKSGRVFFKARKEYDHHSVILREADRAGIDFFGFKVESKEAMEDFDKKLQAYGVKTERMPAGDLPETGERVRFTVPTGHVFEIYAEKKGVGNEGGYRNPEVDIIQTPGIQPNRMDHCLLYGKDIDGTRELMEKVFGFKVVERVKLEDGTTDLATWLTCSTKAHDLALVRHSEDAKLHHVAFELSSWEEVLRAADIMSINRVSIDIGPTRHGITQGTTIYFFDPSGNRLETFAGGYQWYPDYPETVWDWEEVGRGIFYHDRVLNDAFLSVVS